MKIYAVLYKYKPDKPGYTGEHLNVITVNPKVSGDNEPCLYTDKQKAEEFRDYMSNLFRDKEYYVKEWKVIESLF